MSGRSHPASIPDPAPLAGPSDIADAALRLRSGLLVAFPTETVYGLGADALNAEAVARVFEAKGRPSHNPLIVHVLGAATLAPGLVASWPARAATLAAAFWPGPLTIIVPRGLRVPHAVTGGGDTVALRSPDHPIARALLQAFGGPLVGPSANKSGQVSPTTAAHVRSEFDPAVVTVLEGGPCRVGIESTVVSVCGGRAAILRPGSILASQLSAVLSEEVDEPSGWQSTSPASPTRTSQRTTLGTLDAQPPALASPGQLASHYAPRTPVELASSRRALSRAEELTAAGVKCVLLALSDPALPDASRSTHIITMPPDSAAYAARLYAALREADALKHDRIIIALPDTTSPDWSAILDRLKRASAPRE